MITVRHETFIIYMYCILPFDIRTLLETKDSDPRASLQRSIFTPRVRNNIILLFLLMRIRLRKGVRTPRNAGDMR